MRGFYVLLGMFAAFLPTLLQRQAYAFNSLTHEQITQSAFEYMRVYRANAPATNRWLSMGQKDALLERLITRQVIDTDFRPDLWLESTFHDAFTGAVNPEQPQPNVMVTMYLHHINMRKPGKYWANDGYAYRNTTREDNDGILGLPTLYISARRSVVFGGRNDSYPMNGPDYGFMKFGFRGNLVDWKSLLKAGFDISDEMSPDRVTFPPANVPAQMAFEKLMADDRAVLTKASLNWAHRLPLFELDLWKIISNSNVRSRRYYWRAEIEGLPKNLDLLGVTLHMAQDVAMPHHTFATANFCHAELEAFIDKMACHMGRTPPYSIFDDGSFDQRTVPRNCQGLFDPALVDAVFSQKIFDPFANTKFANAELEKAFNPNNGETVSERIRAIAKFTSRWDWSEVGSKMRVMIPFRTKRPKWGAYIRKNCDEFFSEQDIQDTIRYQYNLAVAATVMIFELAAVEYEAKPR